MDKQKLIQELKSSIEQFRLDNEEVINDKFYVNSCYIFSEIVLGTIIEDVVNACIADSDLVNSSITEERVKEIFYEEMGKIKQGKSTDDEIVVKKEEYEKLVALKRSLESSSYIHLDGVSPSEIAKYWGDIESAVKKAKEERTIEIIKDLHGQRFNNYREDEKSGTALLCTDCSVIKKCIKLLEGKYNVEVK